MFKKYETLLAVTPHTLFILHGRCCVQDTGKSPGNCCGKLQQYPYRTFGRTLFLYLMVILMLMDNFQNEDCGQMSAWYIFSAMGFYPVNPVSGEYIVGTYVLPDLPYSIHQF